MREFKFRAWDGTKMIGDFYVDHLGGVTHWEAATGALIEEDWPVMQYTGLRDKNGVEIYAGDVVKARHDDGRYDTGPVVYGGKGAFCLYLPNVATGIKNPLLNYIFGMGLVPESDFEVIGNIYENPELVGETK